jgi:hypothetical protein
MSLEMKNILIMVRAIYYLKRLIVLGVPATQLRKLTVSLPFVFIGPSACIEKLDFG